MSASRPRSVVFLVFDGMKMLDVAGPAEVFAEANNQGAHYELVYASPGGRAVATSIGTTFLADAAAEDLTMIDTAIVSGGDALVDHPLETSVTVAASHLAGVSRRTASICTGAFILAAVGVLDGRRATTHWRHARLLAKLYPEVAVVEDAIYIRDGDLYSSAGVSAGIDLALALVEDDFGPEVARATARSLVVYMQRAGNQSQFSAPLSGAAPHTLALKGVVDRIHAVPSDEYTVAKLAALARLSERQLTRIFNRELQTTPAKYVEAIRFDRAKALLDGGSTVAEAAAGAGFGSTETLRRVFAGRIGILPSVYQQRFRTAIT
jgi:transcriptional regulator GlxA family with amidase domain